MFFAILIWRASSRLQTTFTFWFCLKQDDDDGDNDDDGDDDDEDDYGDDDDDDDDQTVLYFPQAKCS